MSIVEIGSLSLVSLIIFCGGICLPLRCALIMWKFLKTFVMLQHFSMQTLTLWTCITSIPLQGALDNIVDTIKNPLQKQMADNVIRELMKIEDLIAHGDDLVHEWLTMHKELAIAFLSHPNKREWIMRLLYRIHGDLYPWYHPKSICGLSNIDRLQRLSCCVFLAFVWVITSVFRKLNMNLYWKTWKILCRCLYCQLCFGGWNLIRIYGMCVIVLA